MTWSPLPEAPAFPAERAAALADRIGALIGARHDVLIVQGEAAVALEAAAASLARPGLRAITVVTSPYGRWMGRWLARAGAEVREVAAEPGRPVDPAHLERALAAGGCDLLALVHAESATGILNPLDDLLALARAQGALTLVDAVASVGGHPLAVEAQGIDVAVIGPQKALGGQAGVSALSLSPRARAALAPPGEAPSILSLGDLAAGWLETGRGALPGTPSALEFHALEATLDRVEAEGLAALVARHARAGAACRAGIAALGPAPWAGEGAASNLVTAGPLPDGIAAEAALAACPLPEAGLAPGAGPGGDRLLRLNHTGPRARPEIVLGAIAAFGLALRGAGAKIDLAAGLAATAESWAED